MAAGKLAELGLHRIFFWGVGKAEQGRERVEGGQQLREGGKSQDLVKGSNTHPRPFGPNPHGETATWSVKGV